MEFVTDQLKQFDYSSVSDQLGKLVRTFPGIVRDESYCMWQLLVYLNFAISLFSKYDSWFKRKESTARFDAILKLHDWLLKYVKIGIDMSRYVLFTTGPVDEIPSQIEIFLDRLRKESLSQEEYDHLQYICDVICEVYVVPNLPSYRRAGLPSINELLDLVVSENIGKLEYDDIRALGHLIWEKTKKGEYHVTLVDDKERNLQRIVTPFTLTPNRLREIDLAKLLIVPPMFFLEANGNYRIHSSKNVFIYIRHLVSQKIAGFKEKYSNIEGDSMERTIRKFLTDRTLQFSRQRIDFLRVPGKQANHFDHAGSTTISRKDIPDLFELFDRSDRFKPEIEIDLVAHHKKGFSVILESKYTLQYDNLHKYYYEGTDRKMAEGKRLKVISGFLNDNPNFKRLLGIPNGNLVIPVFATNLVGDLFLDDDGVIKVLPFDIMKLGRFLDMIQEYATGG